MIKLINKKKLRCLITTIMLFSVPLISSCSSFFGSDSYNIKSTSKVYDETSGDTIVTITFDNDEVEPMVIRIPRGVSGKDGVGIKDIVTTKLDDSVVIRIIFTDSNIPDTTITIPIINGHDGVSVTGVVVSNDEVTGNVNIKFTYSDGKESEVISIPKGKDGLDGVGIKSITSSKDEETGITTITVSYTDESIPNSTFTISDGLGISTITYNESLSNEDNYVLTITYSDGYKENITLPRPKTTRWYNGVTNPNSTIGSDGDYYLNEETGEVYRKTNNTWLYLFSMKNNTSLSSYKVSFNINGGKWKYVETGVSEVVRTYTYDYGSYVDFSNNLLEVKANDGYKFDGWWTDIDHTLDINSGQLTKLTPILSDLTLYANWKAI